MSNPYKTCFFVFCCTILLSMGLKTAQAAPVNDNIANATLITGETGTIDGNNIDATAEDDDGNPATTDDNEPFYVAPITFDTVPDKTIWYKWKAPDSVEYYFNTLSECNEGIITEELLTTLKNKT